MQIWLYACEGVPSEVLEQARLALGRRGLEVLTPEHWPPSGCGVLLYQQLNDDVRRLVRAAAGVERRGVIAVRAGGGEECAGEAWGVLEAGAADVLSWTGEGCAEEIAARLERRKLIEEYLNSPVVVENIVGRSPAWKQAMEQTVEAAVFSGEPILLTGESGTGKELAARLIHALDTRAGKKDLVVVDCTTLMPELAGSELFGHERGAYTGAVGARAGAIQMADGGTLFLDEIGELGLTLQAQLLRVIQEKSYKRVGGNSWQKANFRLVAATNRDLWAMVEAGTFRRDLYYRIASVPITLPPLRERQEDVIPLARYFVGQMRSGGAVRLDPALEAYLEAREYPGNVRDLRQLMARILHRHCGTRVVSPASLPEYERPVGAEGPAVWPDEGFLQSVRRALVRGVGLQEIAREAKEAALLTALELESGSVKRAAERLGVTERAIHMRRAKGPGTAAGVAAGAASGVAAGAAEGSAAGGG